MLAALAIAALGVLMSAGEYATGIDPGHAGRGTGAPAGVVGQGDRLRRGELRAHARRGRSAAFLAGQAILSSRGLDSVTLSDPGVFRAVVGAAVYLTGAGLIGLAVGALLRNTAGAITTVVGALFVVPGLIQLLPASWNDTISPVPALERRRVVHGGARPPARRCPPGPGSPSSPATSRCCWPAPPSCSSGATRDSTVST